MKKVLVALLVAAMLLVPMSIASYAAFDGCTCVGHSHEICPKTYPFSPEDPGYDAEAEAAYEACDCVYEMTPVDEFIVWLKGFLGPKIADLIYKIIIHMGLSILF